MDLLSFLSVLKAKEYYKNKETPNKTGDQKPIQHQSKGTPQGCRAPPQFDEGDGTRFGTGQRGSQPPLPMWSFINGCFAFDIAWASIAAAHACESHSSSEIEPTTAIRALNQSPMTLEFCLEPAMVLDPPWPTLISMERFGRP